MNKTILFYTRRYFKKNHKKAVPDIVCYFLCLTCVLLVTTLMLSYGQTLRENTWQQNGKQDVLFSYIENEADFDALRHSDVRQVGKVTLWGSQNIPKAIFDGQLVFGTADETARDLLFLQISQGRYPEQAGEVLLENRMFVALNAAVGQTLDFAVVPIGAEEAQTVRLTVVGVCEDFSLSQSGVERQQEIGDCLPNALVYSSPFPAETTALYMAPVQFRRGSQPTDFSAWYQKATGTAGVTFYAAGGAEGSALGLYSMFPISDEVELQYIFGVLMAGCLLTAICSLFLNQYMNREHSREEIRRLKFAGCGNREIHIFFLLRCGICYLCALPPAALATAGAALWFRRQIANFWQIFSLHFSVMLIIAVLLGVFLLAILFQLAGIGTFCRLLPLESEEMITDHHFILNRSLRTRSAVRNLRIKSYFRDRKRMRVCLVLTALCVLLFTGGKTLSDMLLRDLSTQFDYDYQAAVYNMSFATALEIPTNPEAGISSELFARAKALDGIRAVYGMKGLEMKRVTTDRTEYEESSHFDQSDSLDAAGVAAAKRQYGYAENEYLLHSGLTGYSEDLLALITPYITSGSIDPEAFRAGEAVIRVVETGNGERHLGKKLQLSQLFITDGDIYTGTAQVERFDKTTTVTAAISLSHIKDAWLKSMLSGSYGIICSEELLEQLPVSLNYTHLFLFTNENANTDDIDAFFSDLRSLYPDARLISAHAENARLQSLIAVTEVVVSAVNLIIGCFVFVTLFNMIRKKQLEQRRTVALTRILGFGYGKAVRTLWGEMVMMLLPATLLGALMSLPLHLFCFSDTFAETYPWQRPLLALGLLLVFSLLLSIAGLRPVYREKIAVLLRESD